MTKDCITPQSIYLNRRSFLKQAGAFGLASVPLIGNSKVRDPLQDEISDWKHVTRYNNYYEFSTNKNVVFELAKSLTISPWSLEVGGLIGSSTAFSVEELIRTFPVKNYLYRFRCVEGWSAVIPWQGILLKDLLEALQPNSSAKFVTFESIYRPSEMIGQRRNTLRWPYTEGLRLDEALHPLTIIATGMYGKALTKQNGAPLRLVVPWKYGFKSIKALSKITLTDSQPVSSWSESVPSEYGFYANVNPKVAHPRWSQRRELRLGEKKKRKTAMFNGYADQVAYLYEGMDLEKNF